MQNEVTARNPRNVMVFGDIVIVPLTKGYVTVVDIADIDIASNFNWCAHINKKSKRVYAMRWGGTGGSATKVPMHRDILGVETGMIVDHINRDTLDNRRDNLRFASISQNAHNTGVRRDNTSGVKGVILHRRSQRWEARITVNGKRIFLGSYSDIRDAEASRLRAIDKFGLNPSLHLQPQEPKP